MFSSRKRKHFSRKQLSHLFDTFDDFIIGKITNADATENETLEPQASDVVDSFGRFAVEKHSANQDQIIEKNFADKIKKAVVDNAVLTLEDHDSDE